MEESGQVRKATQADLSGIVALETRCFPGPLAYSRRQLRHLLMKANSTVLLETGDGAIRGFVIVLYHRGSTVAGIETIDVDPRFQRHGIARRLLAAAEEDMRTKGITRARLEVSSQNQPARKLYETSGYRTVAVLPDYYIFSHQGSRDALRMVKELS